MKSNLAYKLLILLAVSLLICTSCARSGVGITINEDDTGTVEVSVGLLEKYYQSLLTEEYGGDPFEGKTTTKVQDGDNTYICVTEQKTFQSLDELRTILLSLEYDFGQLSDAMEDSEPEEEDDVWIEAEDTPSEEGTLNIFKTADITHNSGFWLDEYSITLVTNTQDTGDADLSAMIPDMGMGDLMRLVVQITMPGEIVSDRGVIDGNTITITVTDFGVETTLAANSNTVNTVGIVCVVLAILMLVVVLILLACADKSHKRNFD